MVWKYFFSIYSLKFYDSSCAQSVKNNLSILVTLQILTDGDLLYVLNGKGIEIYTCRSNAAVVSKIEDINNITKVGIEERRGSGNVGGGEGGGEWRGATYVEATPLWLQMHFI